MEINAKLCIQSFNQQFVIYTTWVEDRFSNLMLAVYFGGERSNIPQRINVEVVKATMNK